jgi:hypothetical protein
VAVSLDRQALVEGASVAALTAVPFGVVARLVTTNDRASGWAALLAVLVLVGLLLGAGVAAWRQQVGTPMTHGLLTAVGVFVVIQLVGIARRALAGDALHWSRISSSLVLTLIAGLVGGLLGSFLQRSGVRSSR